MVDAVKRVPVQVRAIKPGFDLGRRRVGAEFTHQAKVGADGQPVLPSWLVFVDQPAPPAPVEDEGPRTLGEASKLLGSDLV